MYCSKCGRQNPDGQRFCQYCGAPLVAPAGREFPDRRTPGKKVKKQSFRMKPVYWILIAEIALAAVGIFFGIRLLGERFSARRVVEVYAQALEERDWGTAYDCLNMEGETGLSREEYIAAQEAAAPVQIEQSTVSEVSDAASDYWREVSRQMGITWEESAQDDSVEMEIRSLVNGDMQSRTVTVIPVGKKWFFFDEWKIVPYNMYGEEVEIRIPKNASLIMNGTELDTSALERAGENSEDSGYDSYILPHVFYGGYQIQILQEGMETWSRLVEYSGGSSDFDFSDVYLMPTQETVDTLLGQYGEISQAYFTAAMSGGSFQTLEAYFTREALEEGSIENEFDEVRENTYSSSEGNGCLAVEISAMEGRAVSPEEYYDARPGDVVLDITGTVTTTNVYGSSGPRETSEETRWQACFRREDNAWKLLAM